MAEQLARSDSIIGAILGCAVGDALGVPYEALSRRRGVRLYGPPTRYRFFFGRGMVSDDTEHTCMVGQAICRHPTDAKGFARDFGRRLRWWLLCLPAGIGKATLKAGMKLWLGFSAEKSGVFSAGNGPAMRSAVLGATIDDLAMLKDFVRASTRVTHTDPKAFEGAFTVALAAWCAKRRIDTIPGFFQQFHAATDEFTSEEFRSLMSRVEASLLADESTADFARQIGCERGVSGYTYHTVPAAIHGWLRHPRDYRRAVHDMIFCGGDADTTAAIVGSIVGSGVGRAGIPPEWLDTLCEWPKTVRWMERLGGAVEEASRTVRPVRPPRVFPLTGWLRYLFFLTVVLVHAMRRLLPPY